MRLDVPRSLTCVAVALATVACTGAPAPPPSPSPTASSSPLAAADPDREALAGMLVELEATVAALRAELEAAAAGDDGALDAAAELLVADVGAVTGDAATAPADDGSTADDDDVAEEGEDAPAPTPDRDGPAPLLPGPVVSRAESIQYGDLLTRTLAAARGAGSVGEPARRFLAEPLAGDLGAWQRAPDDQLAAIARAGASSDLASAEAAILELPGEAPRALAWVVHGLEVPVDAADAAGRALAHLAIIELALDTLE